MANAANNYLLDALNALHEATAGVIQWKILHTSSGSSIQDLAIPRTPETKYSLSSLQDSIKSVAGILSDFSANRVIPDKRKPNQQRAAQIIDEARKLVDRIKDCFLYQDDDYLTILGDTATKMEKLVQELEIAADFQNPANQHVRQGRSARVHGQGLYMAGNEAMGSTDDQMQKIEVEGEITGNGTSVSFCDNKVWRLDKMSPEERLSAIQNFGKSSVSERRTQRTALAES
jgi:hypothetical protein